MNGRHAKIAFTATAVLALAAALAAPSAMSALTGSGNVNDIVQLGVVTSSLSTLTASATGSSASASPATSGSSAFTLDNGGSNLDTFVRYDWSATPHYGSEASQTSIAIRSTTHLISDLLWFRQGSVLSAGASQADYYAPLVLKNSGVSRATYTATGNACSAWSGAAADGFTATAAGTLTFRYYAASSQTDDSPLTSDTFHYCLDTANSQIYLGKTASFTAATLVRSYGTDSANGVLKTYQYEFLSGTQTAGNKYCMVGIAGTGTSATPNLVQCQKLPYELAGTVQAKMYVLFDPPAYFPSVNQGGAITYALSATQWNPYSSGAENSA